MTRVDTIALPEMPPSDGPFLMGMGELVAFALALGADRNLRSLLSERAHASDGGSFAVGQIAKQAWLQVDAGRVTAHRQKPDAVPAIDLNEIVTSDPRVKEALRVAGSNSAANINAEHLISALFGPNELLTREEFTFLYGLSPMLEQLAYGSAAAIAASLDLARPHLLAVFHGHAPYREATVSWYWRRIHAMAHLTLLASDQQARPWLADMASGFVWDNWTPTFPLLRERTVWLAACAARSAVAFGEPVVEKYLRSLAKARHPLKALDALFGLTAIGLSCPAATVEILAEIRSLKEHLSDRELEEARLFELAYSDAIWTLESRGNIRQSEVLALVGLRQGGNARRGLATREALRGDPASFTDSGHFIGFAILPTVLTTEPERFYPIQAVFRSRKRPEIRNAAELLRRAWSPNVSVTSTVH